MLETIPNRFVVDEIGYSPTKWVRHFIPPFNPGIFGGGLGQKFLRNIPPDHVEYTTPHVFWKPKKYVGGGTLDARL